VVLDDFVPADHVCRVIDAFVERFVMSDLGFERAEAAETGRPGYDPRDLLKLYLYGYLNQIRSSRRFLFGRDFWEQVMSTHRERR
jgi:transposase